MNTRSWVIVAVGSPLSRAIPKSTSLTPPDGVIITLAALMSRWTTPDPWLASSAESTPS